MVNFFFFFFLIVTRLYWSCFFGCFCQNYGLNSGFVEAPVENPPCKKGQWTKISMVEFYSHPALIATPPTTWAWMLQVRKALERLKLGIKTLETLSPSLVEELLGRVSLSSCHSMAAPWWITRGQWSPTTHEADTDDPRGTTKLGVWTFAHGCVSSSNNDNI